MKKTPLNLRARLLLFTACTVSASLGLGLSAYAQSSETPTIIPGEGASPDLNAYQIQKVKILYRKLLLKEKDLPSSVTELGQKQIQETNPTMG